MNRYAKPRLYFLILVAFCSFFNQFTRCFAINSDKAAQLEATANLSSGLGLTIESVDLHDLSKTNREPLIGWPPGYSVLLLAMDVITDNYLLSTHLLNIAFLVFYLVISYLILEILKIEFVGKIFFYLFTIVTTQPILTLTTTDLIAFDIFLLLFYLLLGVFTYKITNPAMFVLIAFLGFTSVFVKYNFLPFVFLFPVFFIALGWFNSDRKQIKFGIISGAIMAMLVFGFLFYQKIATGHYTYLGAYASAKRLYFENFASHSPFIFEFLFVRDPFKILPFNVPVYFAWIPSILTLGGILICVMVSWRALKKSYVSKTISSEKLTIVFGTIVILVNVLMLYYLSLTSPAQDGNWTYVQEFRYYTPACFFILLFILMAYSSKSYRVKNLALMVLICSVSFGVLNKGFKLYTYGVTALMDLKKFDWRQNDQVKLLDVVTKIVDQNPDKLVVYSDPSSNQRLMALGGAHVISQFGEFTKLDTLSSTVSTIILIASNPDQEVQKFLLKNKFQKISKINEVSLYSLNINPK